MVLSVLNRDFLLRAINEYLITLIPKGEEQRTFPDFRPISLSNAIYKIITEVMVNRLYAITDELITPHQNSFIEGRLIYDNVLIGPKVMHYLTKCMSKTQFWATMKVDFLEAYDSITWDFINQILISMEFLQIWIQFIMRCITNVSYRVLINGETSDQFFPKCGLSRRSHFILHIYFAC